MDTRKAERDVECMPRENLPKHIDSSTPSESGDGDIDNEHYESYAFTVDVEDERQPSYGGNRKNGTNQRSHQ